MYIWCNYSSKQSALLPNTQNILAVLNYQNTVNEMGNKKNQYKN